MSREEVLSIRFGLGAIKAVGFTSMENVINERAQNGKFADIYDFAERIDPKSVNKKSIEALAKAGAFDAMLKNRRQIAESFDILSSYSSEKNEESSSNQMSLFSALPEINRKPELRKVDDWNKVERLGKEFEAFGFFLNEHPIDDHVSELRKRGVVFSDKFERDELEDGDLIITSGVIAASKHRSSARGRFAYLNISDPFGIFEAMIFDEALITSSRDILVDGNAVVLECAIRKDEGGMRILVRSVRGLNDFIKSTKAQEKDFEDIRKQASRFSQKNRSQNFQKNSSSERSSKNYSSNYESAKIPKEHSNTPSQVSTSIKKALLRVEIIIKNKDPIFDLKSFLSQRLSFGETEASTKVTLVVMNGGKILKIELPKNYCLDAGDVERIKKINAVIDVEA